MAGISKAKIDGKRREAVVGSSMGHKEGNAVTLQFSHGAQGSDNHMAQGKHADPTPHPRGLHHAQLPRSSSAFAILSFVGITQNAQPNVIG